MYGIKCSPIRNRVHYASYLKVQSYFNDLTIKLSKFRGIVIHWRYKNHKYYTNTYYYPAIDQSIEGLSDRIDKISKCAKYNNPKQISKY